MLTLRGWWLFLTLGSMFAIGVRGTQPVIGMVALVGLIWFCWEWLRFVVTVRITVPWLECRRQVFDGRGAVTTLWAGRIFEVHATLLSRRGLALEYLYADDPLPFGLEHVDGAAEAQGRLRPHQSMSLHYRVRCTRAGLARFEGMRVRLADLQGFFYHAAFVRAPVALRVLPVLVSRRAALALTKRVNELLPPGVHRHRRPGSGSELLDLRDYLPGDPPKTIAWKISARRDRLITKEFESEVPIRCTLFVDTSASVRVPSLSPPPNETEERWRTLRSLDQLVEIAAGVAQANVTTRDITVLCLFDENESELLKPDRTGSHLTQMLHRLADAAALEPVAMRGAADGLVPLAYAFASEVYPDLLTPEINGMSWWAGWFGEFPRYRRSRGGFLTRIYRSRAFLFFTGLFGIPLLCVLAYAVTVAAVVIDHQPTEVIAPTIGRGLALTVALSGLSIAAALMFFLVLWLFGEPARRRQTWRKRLAALLAERYGPEVTGGIAGLLEDEDRYSLFLQQFLGEHCVPYALPLYDADGQYLFTAAGKVAVLSTAIVRAVGRGRDNELFVLLVDLLELDDSLAPLLRAVKVALGRHHQVLLICPWPPSVDLPEEEGAKDTPSWIDPVDGASRPLPRGLATLTTKRYHAAYRRIRHIFGAIGVHVVCAATEHPIALILDRIDRLRRVRRVH